MPSSHATLIRVSCIAEDPDGCSSSPNQLQSRLREELKSDEAVTIDLKPLVRIGMEALRVTLGDAAWQAVVATVEPVILEQLRGLVA